jgi:hypothetical protein
MLIGDLEPFLRQLCLVVMKALDMGGYEIKLIKTAHV